MPHQTVVEGVAGATQPAEAVKTLNYQELRRMVECAASYREKKVYIVVDDKGWTVETEEPTNTDGKAVIPCMSPGKPGGPKKLALAKIGLEENKPVNLLKLRLPGSDREEEADAVFWTPAAVEKFVVPYYASVYGDQAPKKLSDIISILGVVREPTAAGAPRGQTLEAFAVAHMPKSEYVQVEEPFAVLAADGGGNVQVMSISAYVKPQR